ncbi:hypothetical protein ACTMTI_38085 [Nonomuraea sp. H19]|uniref:hypothetical protein n=1 Tax=Nonomuraea sp. H19 TaxID=3452206 RepID=UPI003F8B3B89
MHADVWPAWIGERANALIAVTFEALRRASVGPRRVGKIVQAALVLLCRENDWTLSSSHNAIFGY